MRHEDIHNLFWSAFWGIIMGVMVGRLIGHWEAGVLGFIGYCFLRRVVEELA